jgi:hypothetical protein
MIWGAPAKRYPRRILLYWSARGCEQLLLVAGLPYNETYSAKEFHFMAAHLQTLDIISLLNEFMEHLRYDISTRAVRYSFMCGVSP